jgi:predicted DNA-binding protein
MATTKVTFTLDDETIARLEVAAASLTKPKSQVVREAIHDYYERMGKLSEAERLRMLRIIDTIIAQPPTRDQREVDRELREIRRARRAGGRRTSVE